MKLKCECGGFFIEKLLFVPFFADAAVPQKNYFRRSRVNWREVAVSRESIRAEREKAGVPEGPMLHPSNFFVSW